MLNSIRSVRNTSRSRSLIGLGLVVICLLPIIRHRDLLFGSSQRLSLQHGPKLHVGHHTISGTHRLDSHQVSDTSSQIPVNLLSNLYENERLSILSQWSQPQAEIAVNSPLGTFNPDLTTYITRLITFVNAYFPNSPYTDSLYLTLHRLGHHIPPPLTVHDLPKIIYTMDKAGKDGVPADFGWWEKRLAKDGWQTVVGDDDLMRLWYSELTASTSGEDDGATGVKWDILWDRLKVPVLKSDLLRCVRALTPSHRSSSIG